MSEKFSLKWNDFQTNVTKNFSSLRADTDFCDVTLVSDDQKQVSAHKIVLSSCSDYFKNILKQNKHAHPLLCLADISSNDLTNVIDYIYNGEVQIYQEDLERFLNVAQRLKLDGLLTPQSNEDPQEAFIKSFDKNIDNIRNVSPEVKVPNEKTNVATVSIPEESSLEDVKMKVLEYYEKDEGGNSRCKLCGVVRMGRNHIQNMKQHIETHLDGITYSCTICGKQFRSSKSIYNHKLNFHR